MFLSFNSLNIQIYQLVNCSFLCRQGSGGHEGKKTLRQLQAEQDDEERFQADLEQAMRQSLGESL